MTLDELIEELIRARDAGVTKVVTDTGQPIVLVHYGTAVYENDQWKNVMGVAIDDPR
jgi:hypothetical protein